MVTRTPIIARYESIQKFFNNYLIQQNHCSKCRSDEIYVIDPISFQLRCKECNEEYSCNYKEIDAIHIDLAQVIRTLKET